MTSGLTLSPCYNGSSCLHGMFLAAAMLEHVVPAPSLWPSEPLGDAHPMKHERSTNMDMLTSWNGHGKDGESMSLHARLPSAKVAPFHLRSAYPDGGGKGRMGMERNCGDSVRVLLLLGKHCLDRSMMG